MNGKYFERLEPRQMLAGIVNGGFSVADPGDMAFGWEATGEIAVLNQAARMREDAVQQTRLQQVFSVPTGTEALEFTIHQLALGHSAAQPPDALEIALLDPTTLQPVVPVVPSIPGADAVVNVDALGRVHFGENTTIPGATVSGEPVGLQFPLSIRTRLDQLAADTAVLLIVDLLGFGDVDSEVTVDDFRLTGELPPRLSLSLDPNTDSGDPGDAFTRFTPINLVGQTDPHQEVRLDVDGDGFDDGTAEADAAGDFRFDTLEPLGATNYRVQATNSFGSSVAERLVRVDSVAPRGVLGYPLPGATLVQDPGYVEVDWTDAGLGGSEGALQAGSFDAPDILIPGVDIDRVQVLLGGRVRYWYSDDGDRLAFGPVRVTLAGGAVTDRAGNPNAESIHTFQLQDTGCAWNNARLPQDTTADEFVTPRDALVVINQLNERAAANIGPVLGPLPTDGQTIYLVDVNCDGLLTPRDALWVINYLNGVVA